MTDVYKLIANMICNSINGKWDKAIVEIEYQPMPIIFITMKKNMHLN